MLQVSQMTKFEFPKCGDLARKFQRLLANIMSMRHVRALEDDFAAIGHDFDLVQFKMFRRLTMGSTQETPSLATHLFAASQAVNENVSASLR